MGNNRIKAIIAAFKLDKNERAIPIRRSPRMNTYLR